MEEVGWLARQTPLTSHLPFPALRLLRLAWRCCLQSFHWACRTSFHVFPQVALPAVDFLNIVIWECLYFAFIFEGDFVEHRILGFNLVLQGCPSPAVRLPSLLMDSQLFIVSFPGIKAFIFLAGFRFFSCPYFQIFNWCMYKNIFVFMLFAFYEVLGSISLFSSCLEYF